MVMRRGVSQRRRLIFLDIGVTLCRRLLRRRLLLVRLELMRLELMLHCPARWLSLRRLVSRCTHSGWLILLRIRVCFSFGLLLVSSLGSLSFGLLLVSSLDSLNIIFLVLVLLTWAFRSLLVRLLLRLRLHMRDGNCSPGRGGGDDGGRCLQRGRRPMNLFHGRQKPWKVANVRSSRACWVSWARLVHREWLGLVQGMAEGSLQGRSRYRTCRVCC